MTHDVKGHDLKHVYHYFATRLHQYSPNFHILNPRFVTGQTCVHLAAVNGHVDVLRYLVANGADINAREGTCGLSALHIAIARQDEQMIAFLLGECRKLDLEVITYGGRTVLEMDRLSPRLRNELLRRGAPTPIMSEDSDEEYDDDDEDEDEVSWRSV